MPRRRQFSEAKRLYHGLSPAAQRGLWALVVFEAILIVAAERDIATRPAGSLRGPKLMWRLIATQNLIGPAAYFAIGRRPAQLVAPCRMPACLTDAR